MAVPGLAGDEDDAAGTVGGARLGRGSREGGDSEDESDAGADGMHECLLGVGLTME